MEGSLILHSKLMHSRIQHLSLWSLSPSLRLFWLFMSLLLHCVHSFWIIRPWLHSLNTDSISRNFPFNGYGFIVNLWLGRCQLIHCDTPVGRPWLILPGSWDCKVSIGRTYLYTWNHACDRNFWTYGSTISTEWQVGWKWQYKRWSEVPN